MTRMMIVALAATCAAAPLTSVSAQEVPEAPEVSDAPEALEPPENTPAEAPAEALQVSEAPEPSPVEQPGSPAVEASAEPSPAVEEAPEAQRRVHLAMRWGMQIYPDAGYDALGDDRSRLSVELAIDVDVADGFSVGLAFVGGGEQDTLYHQDTRWQDNCLFLSTAYRLDLHPALSAYGRIGPTVHWYGIEIGDPYAGPDDRVEIDAWQFGARAALGVEFWPFNPAWIPGMADFGVGLVLEAFYDQAFVSEWSGDNVDLGSFDPSGPGWTLGLTGRF